MNTATTPTAPQSPLSGVSMTSLTDWNDAARFIDGLVETGIHRIFTMNQAPVMSASQAQPLPAMLHMVPACQYLRKRPLDVGDDGPGFTLVGLDGRIVTNTDLKGRPVVIKFTRAANSKVICPGCTPGLHDLNQSFEKFAQRGLELLVVLPVPVDHAKDLVEAMNLRYPIYCDPTWKIFLAYGTGHGGTLPAQAWAILDKQGVVRWLYRSKEREMNVWKDSVPMPEAVLATAEEVLGTGAGR